MVAKYSIGDTVTYHPLGGTCPTTTNGQILSVSTNSVSSSTSGSGLAQKSFRNSLVTERTQYEIEDQQTGNVSGVPEVSILRKIE